MPSPEIQNQTQNVDDANRIQPCSLNPHFWQYRQQPVLLLGGTVEDNLFQIPDLEAHLDELASVGGNYLRCTMSSRDPGNLWPWARDPRTGKFDLTKWEDEYWRRFHQLLQLSAARDLIVQIELWDSHDFYVRLWHSHPLNPLNNLNFTARESGLPESIDYHAFEQIQPFFESVPSLRDLPLLRGYQEAFVDQLLSFSLRFENVLYTMDNETCADPAWGIYWSNYVNDRASSQNTRVETTEMWDNWDPTDGAVPGAFRQALHNHPYLERAKTAETIGPPESYSFVDISNHNMQYGQTHYETARWVRQTIERSARPRPINCVKIYGGEGAFPFGDEQQGLERFWRNLFAGVAAVRFHRPPFGIGLNERARRHIGSMRMLAGEVNWFSGHPAPGNLREQTPNTAFCYSNPEEFYAVCFLDGGRATLNVSPRWGSRLNLRWLSVERGKLHSAVEVTAGSQIPLQAPGGGFQIALLQPTTN